MKINHDYAGKSLHMEVYRHDEWKGRGVLKKVSDFFRNIGSEVIKQNGHVFVVKMKEVSQINPNESHSWDKASSAYRRSIAMNVIREIAPAVIRELNNRNSGHTEMPMLKNRGKDS